jgi:hypothetical protein
MALVLGIVALVVVVIGVATVLVMAGRQRLEETGPASEPGDFVAPVSSGGYRWRQTDESVEQFQARIARENAVGVPPSRPPP